MTNFMESKGFEDYFLSQEMLQALAHVGYTKPTPVQHAAIPLVMAGIDLIVQSQTGTGKTAAFGVPSIELLDPRPGVIEMLVLAPTRELARQVASEIERLGQFKNIKVATIYGGASYEKQFEEIEVANIICATPGRLVDILKRGKISFDNLRVLCLDEADEMLSMGFAEELNTILGFLPEERQSLLFSATITPEVKALAGSMLYYPEFITFSSSSVAAVDVEHSFFSVKGVGRTRDLLQVLQHEEPENAIIFANTKDDTFLVTRFLKRHGFRADVLNGDLAQKDRENTLKALKEGKIDFLVATDVAARGIDISDLSHVINYTLPESAEVYIHRTGRTGRAGKKGKAMSLVSPKEMGVLFNIKKLYKFPITEKATPSAEDVRQARRDRRVESLMSTLSVNGLPYGNQMGIAEALVGGDDLEKIRFVAKLIALALRGDTLASTEVAAVLERTPEEASPIFEVSAPDAPKAPQEAAVEAPVETPVADEPSGGRRRRRRRSGSDELETEARTDAPSRPERSSERSETKSVDQSGSNRGQERRRRDASPSERPERPRTDQPPKAQDRPSQEKAPERTSQASSRPERKQERPRSEKPQGRNRRGGRNERERSTTPMAPLPEVPREFAKVWINRGKANEVDRDAIVEMVCYMAGIEPEDLGQISVEQTFSYAEVREDYLYDIIQAMNQQDYQGVTISAEPARRKPS